MSQSVQTTYPQSSLLAHEIAQQPELWPDTLARVQAFTKRVSLAGKTVVFTGAGTSAYAAQCVADTSEKANAIATTDLLLLSAEEIEARVPGWKDGGVLVSLARSGNSPESAGVVRRVQKMFPGVQHVAISCNADSRLTEIAGVEVLSLDGRTNDRSLAMTSSFSNLVLAGMALFDAGAIADDLPEIARNVRGSLDEMFVVASDMAAQGADRFVVLTSTMHALAQEMTLKSLELTAGAMVGMAESFLGFRHGPISFLREDTPVLCVLSNDPLKQRYEEDVVEELRTRGVPNVCLLGAAEGAKLPHRWVVPAMAPMLPDALRAPFEVVFAQLLAYAHSVQAGIDPDNPSPDGEITRVVRPFALHG